MGGGCLGRPPLDARPAARPGRSGRAAHAARHGGPRPGPDGARDRSALARGPHRPLAPPGLSRRRRRGPPGLRPPARADLAAGGPRVRPAGDSGRSVATAAGGHRTGGDRAPGARLSRAAQQPGRAHVPHDARGRVPSARHPGRLGGARPCGSPSCLPTRSSSSSGRWLCSGTT